MSITDQTPVPAPTAEASRTSEPAGSAWVTIPRSHLLTSLLGIGPIPFTKIVPTHAMVHETNTHPAGQVQTADLTHREAATRAHRVKSAQGILRAHLRKHIEPRIATIKALHAEINQIDRQIKVVQDSPIIGVRGEKYTYDGARLRHRERRERLITAADTGSQAHHVKPRSRIRTVGEYGSLGLDAFVFLFAMVGILNVNLRLLPEGDFTTTVRFIVAVVFAILATAVLAMANRSLGRRHRNYKNDSGTIGTDPVNQRTIRLEVAALIGLIVLAASVMAARVVLDASSAEADWWLTAPLAAFMAAILAFSAYVNYRSEYDDGSILTDEVNHLSARLTDRDLTIAGLRNLRQLKVEEAGVLTAKLRRTVTTARTTAQRHVTDSTADRAIHLARSYTTGTIRRLPDPDLSNEPFTLAEQQATELADHQRHLESTIDARVPTDALDADLLTLLAETAHQ